MISAQASVPRALALRAALVVAGSALLAISAQIAVPMFPVPITLQTLAVPLLVLAIGPQLAVAATLAYLLEGALGLPVFSHGSGGIARLVGPTAGFLWTFPVAAYVIGVLLQRGLGTSYVGRWLAIFAGTAVVFVGGAWWLAAGLNLSFMQALEKGVFPFLVGDLLKCTIAAGLSPQWERLFRRLGL